MCEVARGTCYYSLESINHSIKKIIQNQKSIPASSEFGVVLRLVVLGAQNLLRPALDHLSDLWIPDHTHDGIFHGVVQRGLR